MLPTALRLHSRTEFAAVMRRGRRAGTPTLVVHLLVRADAGHAPARAGFVVSAKVGNSVVRHRLTRQLRPLVRPHLEHLPTGTDVVVRVLPGAAGTSTSGLDRDLRTGLTAVVRKGSTGNSRARATR